MEQGTGIEPAFTAWEAVVLPIYEPCDFDASVSDACSGIIAKENENCNLFLSEKKKIDDCLQQNLYERIVGEGQDPPLRMIS